MMDYSYYSEDYFENGQKCGTAYANYMVSSRSSPIYKGIAETLIQIFNPQSSLEIGCATGVVVKRLNAMGVDAHGVDVSEWAVQNREHAKVILAGAEKLPYADSQFDLVYSIHALEHIPVDLSAMAFAEMRRVTRAHQLHMLPLVGTPPYDGNRDAVITGLKKDPTHNLLYDREWWIERLVNDDFVAHDFRIIWPTDTESFELATCQIMLSRRSEESRRNLIRLVDAHNIQVARVLHSRLNSIGDKSTSARISSSTGLLRSMSPPLDSSGVWSDLVATFAIPANFTNSTFKLLINTEANRLEEIKMRLALLAGVDVSQTVYEKWFVIEPGVSIINFASRDLNLIAGDQGLSSIDKLYFGGIAKGRFQILLSIDGETVDDWSINGA